MHKQNHFQLSNSGFVIVFFAADDLLLLTGKQIILRDSFNDCWSFACRQLIHYPPTHNIFMTFLWRDIVVIM